MIIYYIWLLLQSVVFADYCTEEMFPEPYSCTFPQLLPSVVALNTIYTFKVPTTIPAYFVSSAGLIRYSDCLNQCPADHPSSLVASINSAAENDEVD